MRKPLGANRERGVWGASEASPPPDFLEEPAAQFPPNHLLAPSGLIKLLPVILFTSSILGCTILKETLGFVAQKPKVVIESIRIAKVDLKELKLEVHLSVENPNAFDLVLSDLHYSVNIHDSDVASGIHKDELKVAAYEKKTIEIPLSIQTQNTLQVLGRILFERKPIPLHWQGQANFHSPIGPMIVKFSDQKEITL
ncbi:MAG: LEA type 2 family protein [Deltaproteobacteria bacterium]|nr:LEA type 2 family protein [Deltaproteobacteria bacterium]